MLLEHIVTDQRYYPDYYRVTFYGNFPGAIRDKRFIVSDRKQGDNLVAEIYPVSWLRMGEVWRILRAYAE
jgi:hypothetical protein